MTELALFQDILGQIDGHLSLWPTIRDYPEQAGDEALDVLATWAHLRRFPNRFAAGEGVARLDRLVHEDRERLVEYFLRRPYLADWSRELKAVEQAWEDAGDSTSADLERRGRQLFDDLDSQCLAVYAARNLLPDTHPLQEALQGRAREIDAAEDVLAENTYLFFPAAALAAEALRAYRPNLDEADPALWLTTLKHARLVDWAEERRGGVLPPPLPPEELFALLNLPRPPAHAARDFCRALEPSFAMAAKAPVPDALEDLRAALVVVAAAVEGEGGLTVSLDVLLSREERRPVGLQVRLRSPQEARTRYRRATLQLPRRTPADVIDLSAGRGSLPLNELELLTLVAGATRSWRLTLTDADGRQHLVLLE